MPGGLSSWLDDESSSGKNEARVPLLTANPNGGVRSRSEVSVIDVDGASPEAAPAARGGKTPDMIDHSSLGGDSMPGSTKKAAWDPFGRDSASGARENAFARLRQGAAAGHAAAAGCTPSPPASRDSAASSSWDPFACAGDDGKENQNAFSKLFAAASQHGNHSKGRSGGGPASAKRKRPGVGLPNAAMVGAGGAGGASEAATRFCECPVCGKKVIIELCSKHLDTECGGADATSTLTPTTSASTPSLVTPDSRGSTEPVPRATLPSTASSTVAVISDRSPSRHKPATRHAATPGLASKLLGTGQEGRSGGSAAVTPPTAVFKAAKRAMSASVGSVETMSSGAGGESKSSRNSPAPSSLNSPSAPLPPSSCPAVASATSGAAATPVAPVASATKTATSRRRKTARGAPGRKGSAASTVTAAAAADAGAAADADSEALIPCPVCGEHVRADLCSWHLDTDCAGAKAAADGKGASAAVDGGREGAGEDGSAGGTGAKKKDGGSEVEGGLNALAAELTCPVCLCVFEDVHVLPCSHRFCLECITGCFRSSKRQECPLCKIPAWKRDLTRDVPLQNIIVAYRRMAA